MYTAVHLSTRHRGAHVLFLLPCLALFRVSLNLSSLHGSLFRSLTFLCVAWLLTPLACCRHPPAESSAALAKGENIKLMVVAPRISISFGGAGQIDATPAMPREQLQALLQDDLLPRYSRILSERTATNDGEREALASVDPAETPYVKDHLERMQKMVKAQIEKLFAPSTDTMEVQGQRRAAIAAARGR